MLRMSAMYVRDRCDLASFASCVLLSRDGTKKIWKRRVNIESVSLSESYVRMYRALA